MVLSTLPRLSRITQDHLVVPEALCQSVPVSFPKTAGQLDARKVIRELSLIR